MRPVGYSTGALARGDFEAGLALSREHKLPVVELSALRVDELEPLVTALPNLPLGTFSYVSLHAPSRFERSLEQSMAECLANVAVLGYPIVMHPDVMFTPEIWRGFGSALCIENMDKRKPVGRNVRELAEIFRMFPDATWCFDIGHARQVDPSMTEASALLRAFGDRLTQVHISEVNTASRHDPVSKNAVMAFQTVAARIAERIPIVLESLIDAGQSDIVTEVARAREALAVCSIVGA
jgi:hypothetical protein